MFGFMIRKCFDYVAMMLADIEICAALKGCEDVP
jgi:hypothetical protein